MGEQQWTSLLGRTIRGTKVIADDSDHISTLILRFTDGTQLEVEIDGKFDESTTYLNIDLCATR